MLKLEEALQVTTLGQPVPSALSLSNLHDMRRKMTGKEAEMADGRMQFHRGQHGETWMSAYGAVDGGVRPPVCQHALDGAGSGGLLQFLFFSMQRSLGKLTSIFFPVRLKLQPPVPYNDCVVTFL